MFRNFELVTLRAVARPEYYTYCVRCARDFLTAGALPAKNKVSERGMEKIGIRTLGGIPERQYAQQRLAACAYSTTPCFRRVVIGKHDIDGYISATVKLKDSIIKLKDSKDRSSRMRSAESKAEAITSDRPISFYLLTVESCELSKPFFLYIDTVRCPSNINRAVSTEPRNTCLRRMFSSCELQLTKRASSSCLLAMDVHGHPCRTRAGGSIFTAAQTLREISAVGTMWEPDCVRATKSG